MNGALRLDTPRVKCAGQLGDCGARRRSNCGFLLSLFPFYYGQGLSRLNATFPTQLAANAVQRCAG